MQREAYVTTYMQYNYAKAVENCVTVWMYEISNFQLILVKKIFKCVQTLYLWLKVCYVIIVEYLQIFTIYGLINCN